MDRDLQVYYETLMSLFASDGWKLFVGDQEEAFEHLVFSACRECPENNAWQYRRGYLDALHKIINFEDIIRNNYDMLEKESTIDAEYDEVVH
jgi:hypothetical protein